MFPRSSNRRNQVVYKPPTPYCSFCAKAGDDADPWGHWRTDRAGKITCPRLLATECKFCGKTGHTAKFCGERAFKEKEEKLAERKRQQQDLEGGQLWMASTSRARPPARIAAGSNSELHNASAVMPGGRFGVLLCEESEPAEPEPAEPEPEPAEPEPEKIVQAACVLAPRKDELTWATMLQRSTAVKWGTTPLEAAKKKISWDASIPNIVRTKRWYPTARPAELSAPQWSAWATEIPLDMKKWAERDEDGEELPDVHVMFAAEAAKRASRDTRLSPRTVIIGY